MFILFHISTPVIVLEQGGKDDGGDKGGDKPNWLSWVGDELNKSPIAVVVTLFVGMLWTFQREVELQNYKTRLEAQTISAETRLDAQTMSAETRIQMLTGLLDMEYHDEYISWRGK